MWESVDAYAGAPRKVDLGELGDSIEGRVVSYRPPDNITRFYGWGGKHRTYSRCPGLLVLRQAGEDFDQSRPIAEITVDTVNGNLADLCDAARPRRGDDVSISVTRMDDRFFRTGQDAGFTISFPHFEMRIRRAPRRRFWPSRRSGRTCPPASPEQKARIPG